MMYHIQNARQYDGNKRTQWFTDEYFDLVVWFGDDASIVAFQLVYDRMRNPHALTWKKDRGYLHEKVDDGEVPGQMKMTPILIQNGLFRRDFVAAEFGERSREIDREVAGFVHEKLMQYRGD